MDFLIFLLIVNFSLFTLALIFILVDVMKANKKSKEANNNKGIGKLRGYSFGMGLLSMLMMIFIASFYSA